MLELRFRHDALDESGETPLHTAAYEGHADAVRLLLAAGAEVDACDTRFGAPGPILAAGAAASGLAAAVTWSADLWSTDSGQAT
jgi:ankyrin repeat protein